MNRGLWVLLGATLALAACEKVEKHSTTVSHSSDINGRVNKSGITLSDYAMRAALGNNPNTAAYVTVKNIGTSNDRLIGAKCACAATASLHTMKMNGQVMEMNEVTDGFVIKPGETLVFKPGGNHIMLAGLKTHPQDGDTQTLTLVFEKAGPIDVVLPVSNTPLVTKGTSDAMAGMKM